MQAIILAAGMGKRLGELTRDNTKCMVQVNNKTLIERMLCHLTKLELTRIILVIGYKGENLKKLVGDKVGNIPVTYVVNPIYDKTNNIYSLDLAKDYLIEDDTLLLESDLIIEDDILKKLINDPYPNLAVVARFESWMDGTVVTLDDNDNILSFVPKKNFRYQDIPLYFKTVNIYKFSKEFSRSHYVPFLDAYCSALGNNEYYEQVLRVISLLDKPGIKALRLNNEKWYEIDDAQDLDNAETIFAEPDDKLEAYQKRRGGYWRYPELTDFSNLTNCFFPTPILRNELSTNFQTLLSAQPSDVNVIRLLAAKNFSINIKSVVVANDRSELLSAYLKLYPVKTGIVYPVFEEHSREINSRGFTIFNNNSHLTYTVEDLIAFYSENALEQIIIANPDNQSGHHIPLHDLIDLLNWTKYKGVKIIIDESFVDFADHSETLLTDATLEKYLNLVVLRDIPVAHGIPGLKLAVAASGDSKVIEAMKEQLPRFGINSISEFYMQVFSKYDKEYFAACNLMKQERDRLYDELKKIDYLVPMSSQANFILCKVKEDPGATKLADRLLTKCNMLIRDVSLEEGMKNKNYVRIAVRDKDDNDRLISNLKNVFKI